MEQPRDFDCCTTPIGHAEVREDDRGLIIKVDTRSGANPETCWHNLVAMVWTEDRNKFIFCCVSCDSEVTAPGERYEYDIDANIYIHNGSGGRVERTQT